MPAPFSYVHLAPGSWVGPLGRPLRSQSWSGWAESRGASYSGRVAGPWVPSALGLVGRQVPNCQTLQVRGRGVPSAESMISGGEAACRWVPALAFCLCQLAAPWLQARETPSPSSLCFLRNANLVNSVIP